MDEGNSLSMRPDTEALRCWSCERKFWLDAKFSADEFKVLYADEYASMEQWLEEGTFWEWGRKSADEPYRVPQ
jgi:hypothetical protein